MKGNLVLGKRLLICRSGKRGLLRKVIILLVAAAAIMLLSSATRSESERLIIELVTDRIETMNGYFDGEYNYKEACRALEITECGRLLEEDINSFKSYFGTDIEKVEDYKITKVEVNYEDDELICAYAEIEWRLRCIDDVYRSSAAGEIDAGYSIIAEKNDGVFKLVQFR